MNHQFDLLNNADNELNKIIYIKVIQRNGKKNWTLVECMETIDNFTKNDYKKQLKYLKKKLCCNGSIQKKKDNNDIFFQFQGDHKEKLIDYFKIKYSLDNCNIR